MTSQIMSFKKFTIFWDCFHHSLLIELLQSFKLPVYWTGSINIWRQVPKAANMWFHKIFTFFLTVQYHNKHYSGVLKEAQMTCFIKPVSRKIAVLMNAFFNCWLGEKIDLWKARKAFAACIKVLPRFFDQVGHETMYASKAASK